MTYPPSPPRGVWHVGFIPVRAYALCIIAGTVVAGWWTERWWQARGEYREDVLDAAMRVVPFGWAGAGSTT